MSNSTRQQENTLAAFPTRSRASKESPCLPPPFFIFFLSDSAISLTLLASPLPAAACRLDLEGPASCTQNTAGRRHTGNYVQPQQQEGEEEDKSYLAELQGTWCTLHMHANIFQSVDNLLFRQGRYLPGAQLPPLCSAPSC